MHSVQDAGRAAQNDAAAGRAARQSIESNAANAQSARQSPGTDAAYTQTASPSVPDGIADGNGGSSQSTAQNVFASSAQSRALSQAMKAMPRFSALAEQAPENESPFYNGRAVPPEQAAAKSEDRPEVQVSPQSVPLQFE